MDNKVCDKCGKTYDNSLKTCPYCSENSSNAQDYNIRNPFLEMSNRIKEETPSLNISSNEENKSNFSFINNNNIEDNNASSTTNSNIGDKKDSFTSVNNVESNNNSFINNNADGSSVNNEFNKSIENNKKSSSNTIEQNIDPELLKNLHNPALDFGPDGVKTVKEDKRVKEEVKKSSKENMPVSLNNIQKKMVNYFLLLMFISLAIAVYVSIYQFQVITVLHYGLIVLFHVVGYLNATKKKKIAGYIGVLVSITMILAILEHDIIDMLLGIFMLIHSIIYIIKFDK